MDCPAAGGMRLRKPEQQLQGQSPKTEHEKQQETKNENVSSSSSIESNSNSNRKESEVDMVLRELQERVKRNSNTEDDQPPSKQITVRDEQVEIPSSVIQLKSAQGGDVFLVGTAHVSKASVAEVENLIQRLKPDTVMVELCKSRLNVLFASEESSMKELNFQEMRNLLREQGSQGLLHILISLLYQRVMKHLHVMPGGEFRAAAQEARKLGALVILGDRPIEVVKHENNDHPSEDVAEFIVDGQVEAPLSIVDGQVVVRFAGGTHRNDKRLRYGYRNGKRAFQGLSIAC
jgi:hypothetical protein